MNLIVHPVWILVKKIKQTNLRLKISHRINELRTIQAPINSIVSKELTPTKIVSSRREISSLLKQEKLFNSWDSKRWKILWRKLGHKINLKKYTRLITRKVKARESMFLILTATKSTIKTKFEMLLLCKFGSNFSSHSLSSSSRNQGNKCLGE